MRLNPAAWPGPRHEEALAKMVEDVVAATKDCEHRILAIHTATAGACAVCEGMP